MRPFAGDPFHVRSILAFRSLFVADHHSRCVSDPESYDRCLCQLINALPDHDDSQQRRKLFALLSNYIYFQCSPNIKSRLNLSLAPGQPKIYDLLLGIDIDDIASSPITWDDSSIPERVLSEDESWVLEIVKEHDEDAELLTSSEAVDKPLSRLRPTEDTLRATWIVFIHNLEYIQHWLGKPLEDDCASIRRSVLDNIAIDMSNLEQLVRRSPTFWHMLRDVAVRKVFWKCVETVRLCLGCLINVPSVLTSSKATHTDSDSDGQNVEDQLGWRFEYSPRGLQEGIGRWVQSLCQWYLALSEIRGTYFNHKARRHLSIKTITPPLPVKLDRQASLSEAIKSLESTERKKTKAWAVLKARADRELCRPNFASLNGKLGAGWTALSNGEEDRTWEHLFSGKVHCLALLSHSMDGKDYDHRELSVRVHAFMQP